MRGLIVAALALGILVGPAYAQFQASAATSQVTTVAAVQEARLSTYVTVARNIVAHERGDVVQDATGQMRAEIEPEVWRGRNVTPTTPVRLFGEVDRGSRGRYLSVERLDIAE